MTYLLIATWYYTYYEQLNGYEYALRDINKPIGVSSFIMREIPFEVKSQLPTVEQLEQELKDSLHASQS